MPGSRPRPLPGRDLDHILAHTRGLWEDLRGARLFVTGGTGFFGRWMLESFLKANDELSLGAEVLVLTRDPRGFADAAPHVVRDVAIKTQTGDVKSFAFPLLECTHVLHMATETALGASPTASFQTAVEGTERVLAFAARSGARKLLLTSSGAVYGPQPPDCQQLAEEHIGAPWPEDVSADYAHGKRAAEFLCSVAAVQTELQVKMARCFAIVGPGLPLNANFAIGNFIRDALYRDRIEVTGDGTPRRSYLYAADLAVWLWTILFRGESGRPYNVGSEEDVSISELAHLVARVVRPGIPVNIAQAAASGALPARYIPSTTRAAHELDVHSRVDLDDAVLRTADWYLAGPTHRRQDESRKSLSMELGPRRHLLNTKYTSGPLTAKGDSLMEVLLGERPVGDGHPCFVVGEIGINHNGDIEIAKRLIRVAAAAGCDAVKFQKRTPSICVPEAQREIMRETPWGYMSYLDYREHLELGIEAYREIDSHCRKHEIPWFASCWDEPSVELIEQFDVPCFKIASACLTDEALLRRTRATGKPLVLSTGMSSLEQIDRAVGILGRKDLILLQAVSTYPARYDELNLRVIATLRERYDVPVGYSGHETGLASSIAAVALGACVIERHITLDRSMWGSDQAASLEPSGLTRLLRDIRLVETSLGSPDKRVLERELPLVARLRLQA